MKRIFRTVRTVAVITAATLFLASCLITADDGDVGALRIDIPAVGASAIGSSDVVRVWMYAPSGAEYRLAPGGGGIPTANNYVQVVGGGSVVIDQIPAGRGYGIVVVVDTGAASSASSSSYVFTPDRFAFNFDFPVAPGQETVLDLTLQDLPANAAILLSDGSDVNSVVVFQDSAVAATSTAVLSYEGPGTGWTSETAPANAQPIYSLSTGLLPVEGLFSSSLLSNTARGVYGDGSTQIADLMAAEGITDVVSSGTFSVDATTQVLYYQRLGGLGGVTITNEGTFGTWFDTGSDLADYVDPDETPVRAAVGSTTSNAVYVSTKFGTFRATEALFNGDLDVSSLLSGESTAGLTFFGVAAPGSDRPVRITSMGLVEIGVDPAVENLVVGTGRGVAYFPVSAINSAASNGGLVPATQVTWIPVFRDQVVLDMEVTSSAVAVVTPQRVGYWRPNQTSFSLPLRALSVGVPRDIALSSDSPPTLVLAGSEGISKVGSALLYPN